MSELDALIREQEKDARTGDRVFSVSLDAEKYDGVAMLDRFTSDDGRDAGFLKPRLEHKTKPIRGLVGHRSRQRARKRMYGAVCVTCGAVTDGSNGRAKAPRVCAQCLRAKAQAERDEAPHGSMRKYRSGCRCNPCRWENARLAWDAREKRMGRA